MIIHMDKEFPNQPPEKYYGNKEYKRFIDCHSENINYFINKRASQMLFRLIEGDGNAIYILGINDNGIIYSLNKYYIEKTLKYIKIIANQINADIKVIRIYKNNVCTVRIHLEPNKLNSIKNNISLF